MSAVANNLEFADWLTMECLRLLKNKKFILGGFNTGFADQYTKEFAVGETVRVPIPWRPIGGTGMDYNPEAIDRTHYTITVDKTPHVHFEVGAVEEALKFTRGKDKIRDEILEPAMNTMKTLWETEAATWAFRHTSNVVGALGTDATAYSTVGLIQQRMMQMAGWEGSKIFAVSPSTNTSMINAYIANFNPGDEISKAFKEGYLGRHAGFDWQQSMYLVRHTAGTWSGAVTLSSAVTSGATTLALTCTTGDTFLAGDKIGINGYYPVNPETRATFSTTTFQVSVLESVTGEGSAATISIAGSIIGPGSPYQNIDALPASGTALTLWPGTASPNGQVGTVSLAFNKDSFAFCGVKLANPTAVEIASQTRDPKSGLTVAFVKAFDPISRKMVHRFDSLGGFGDFYARNGSVALGGA